MAQASASPLADDATVVERLFEHIDKKTTDLGAATWREPTENYRSEARFAAELKLVLRRHPVAFCPGAALAEPGAYIARASAGTPLVAVRGNDGRVRVFRNACRHRGTQLAADSGCEKAFVCRYHGWAYGLDGRLIHVPHEHGFPGLDKSTRGLVEVPSVESHGIVFVAQDAKDTSFLDEAMNGLPPLIEDRYVPVVNDDREQPANWKILAEGFLEGYHIRTTHSKTFYPVQYDNVNVIETFGRNSRVTFPYRSIEKLRDRTPDRRSIDGKLTYVYHIFPNTMVATFPGKRILAIIEPVAIDRTRLITYVLADRDAREGSPMANVVRGADLIEAGGAEDRDAACAIQSSLASGANEFFEFGYFESAIVHFHKNLHAALGEER